MADELNFPSSCHSCEPIDLKKYLYKKIHGAIPLGSWSRIKSQENCGLCWLVVQAIRLKGLDLDGDTVISLLNRMSWKLSEAKSEYDQVYFTTPSNRGDLKAQAVADAIETGHFAYQFIIRASDEEDLGYIQFLADPLSEKFQSRFSDEEFPELLMRLYYGHGWTDATGITGCHVGKQAAHLRKFRQNYESSTCTKIVWSLPNQVVNTSLSATCGETTKREAVLCTKQVGAIERATVTRLI